MIGPLAAIAWDNCPACGGVWRPHGPVLVVCSGCGAAEERTG